MQVLRKDELPAAFAKLGFTVSTAASWYGYRIDYERSIKRRLADLSIRPVLHSALLPTFLLELVRWVSQGSSRLLWIEHYKSGFLSFEMSFHSLLGRIENISSLNESPGFYFEPIDVQEAFNQSLEAEPSAELEKMLSLLCVVLLAEWDAKLLSLDGCDHVEFWEGNVVFYSDSLEKIKLAREVAERFGLPIGKK